MTGIRGPVAALLLINPRSGEEPATAEELAEAAAERGVEARVVGPADDLRALARAAPAGPLGVAGGHGSLAPVAGVALERGLPFVAVPFGTRNHFVRDLGVDRNDPIGALAAFDGVERIIDVGRVGDRVFLNNVSLGLYSRLVHRRESHRLRREALASVRALALAVREPHRLHATIDGRPVAARVILVANNAYTLSFFSLGARERIDAGRLHLYVAEGLLPGSWRDHSCTGLTLDSAAAHLLAAVDGEPAELRTPVAFSVEPRALTVLVPPPG